MGEEKTDTGSTGPGQTIQLDEAQIIERYRRKESSVE